MRTVLRLPTVMGVGGATISPSDISGLVAWYDFSDISTLYQDSGKTTPVASDGDPIGAAVDKSGNGNDVLQATTANKPTYKTGIQNGLAIARGDGADYLITSAAVQVVNSSSGEWTAAAVADQTGGGTGIDGVTGTDDYTNPTRIAQFLRFNMTSGVIESIAFDTTPTAFADASASYAAGFNTMIGLRGATSIEAYMNGGTNGSTSTTGTPETAADKLIVFSVRVGTSPALTETLTGDIGEVILYNRELTSSERAQLETYLNDKWAVY